MKLNTFTRTTGALAGITGIVLLSGCAAVETAVETETLRLTQR